MASVDDAQTNKKFAEANEANFPILSDPGKAAAKAYGVLSLIGLAKRHTIYINAEGRIAFIDRKVSVASAGADTARRLRELGVPERDD